MSSAVLDASAILALLNSEPGADKLTPELRAHATCSTVNIAEVQARLVRQGIDPEEAWESSTSVVSDAVPFSLDQAKVAGTLVSQTRPLGLSLGDRACLALALTLGSPVYTADRAWKQLKVGLRVHVIR